MAAAVELQARRGEGAGDVEGREGRADTADEQFFRSRTSHHDTDDQNVATGADVGAGGDVNEFLRSDAAKRSVVDFDQRHAGGDGCVADLRGVAAGIEADQERGVEAPDPQWKCTHTRGGGGDLRDGSADAPVVVVEEGSRVFENPQPRIGENAGDAEKREGRTGGAHEHILRGGAVNGEAGDQGARAAAGEGTRRDVGEALDAVQRAGCGERDGGPTGGLKRSGEGSAVDPEISGIGEQGLADGKRAGGGDLTAGRACAGGIQCDELQRAIGSDDDMHFA